MDEKDISQNIKKRRLEQGFTLAELARATGLTKGYLSKVEHADKAPPYATLEKIARALNTRAPTLIDPHAPETPKKSHGNLPPEKNFPLFLSRSGDRIDTPLKGYAAQALARGKPGKNMVPLVIYPPFDLPPLYRHPGEAMIYVMEGNLEFIHGLQTHILNANDSVYFDASTPHAAKSLGKNKAKLLVVLYFYQRLPHPL